MEKVFHFGKSSREKRSKQEKLSGQKLFSRLLEENSPKTLIIACSDPFGMPLPLDDPTGKCSLVIQNLGALVPPYRLANENIEFMSSIDYALNLFCVEQIVVIGHIACPVLKRFKEKKEILVGGLSSVEELIQYETQKNSKVEMDYLYKETIVRSCQNLLQYPAIKSKILRAELYIHGWLYDAEIDHLDFLVLHPPE